MFQLLSLLLITAITLLSHSFTTFIVNILLLLWLLQSMLKERWRHIWYWFLLAVVLLDFTYICLLLVGVDASTLGIELCVAYLLGAVFVHLPRHEKKRRSRAREGGAA